MNRYLITALAISALTVALSPAMAHADPVTDDYLQSHVWAICTTLDAYPNIEGIIGIMQGISKDGLTDAQTGEVLVRAIVDGCPQHKPELKKFLDEFLTSPGVFKRAV